MRKPDVILDSVSNGLGSQSMYLVLLATRGEIPATVAITADTGAENDCLWNTGERTSAREYFEKVVFPFCSKRGVDARFVRAVDKNKLELPDLTDHLKSVIAEGKMKSAKIPLFGSRGGRLQQTCTDKWKIRAIKQEARRLGATRLITAQGIHFGEAGRRVKGRPIGKYGEWTLYQDTVTSKVDGEKVELDIKWCQHYYPLVDRQMGRTHAIAALQAEGIPFLVASQCDFCPHKDLPRWERSSPETIAQIAAIESSMNGEFFFTDQRIPLVDALEVMRSKARPMVDTNFGCGNSYCGI